MLNIGMGVCVFVVLIGFIMLLRNNLIYKYRIRKLDEVSAAAKKLIKERHDDFLAPYRDFENSASYEKMLFQLHKWSYRAFYR